MLDNLLNLVLDSICGQTVGAKHDADVGSESSVSAVGSSQDVTRVVDASTAKVGIVVQ